MNLLAMYKSWRRGGAPEKFTRYSPWAAEVTYSHSLESDRHHVKRPLMRYTGPDGYVVSYDVGDIVPMRDTDYGIAYYRITKVRQPGRFYDGVPSDNGITYDMVFYKLKRDVHFDTSPLPVLVEIKTVDTPPEVVERQLSVYKGMLEQVGLEPFAMAAPEWKVPEAITETDMILHEGEELDENFCDAGGHFDMEAAMEAGEAAHDVREDR